MTDKELIKAKNKRPAPRNRSTPQKKKKLVVKSNVDIDEEVISIVSPAGVDLPETPIDISDIEAETSMDRSVTEIETLIVSEENTSGEYHIDMQVSNYSEKSTQTIYDKYILGAKVESILARNAQVVPVVQPKILYGNM